MLRKGILGLLTEEEDGGGAGGWRRAAERSPGRVPADGPDGGEGAPRPLDLHLLLAALVADADDPVEHPQGQVLPVVGPAVQTTARGHGAGKGNTQVKAVRVGPGFRRPDEAATAGCTWTLM